MSISKIIIPAAGLGTRLLPMTALLPKELALLGRKTALETIFDEALAAGITQAGLIISPQKEIIKDYCFKKVFQNYLPAQQERLSPTLSTLDSMQCSFFYQHKPAGVADALLKAESFIKNDWFAIAFPDDIIHAQDMKNMVQAAQKHNACVVALQKVPQNKVSMYGIAKPKEIIDDNLLSIDSFIEKPETKNAPSNMAIVGRYIMPPTLFNWIKKTKPNPSGEILFPDTISLMIQNKIPVLGYVLSQPRFDIGTLAGWKNYIIKN